MKNVSYRFIVSLFLLPLLQVALSFPAAATDYTITDLGTLAGHNRSGAYDINNIAQVVGFSDPDPYHGRAFLWENGQMINLGSLLDFSGADAINESAWVVGKTDVPDQYFPHACLWKEGTISELIEYTSYAHGINGSGQIVGDHYPQGRVRAFLINNPSLAPFDGIDKKVKDLGTLGGSYASALDINTSGQIVGSSSDVDDSPSYAFLWENDQMTKICKYESQANAINDSGHVAGWYYDGSTYQAFLWKDGVSSIHDTIFGWSKAEDINKLGQVVGTSGSGAFIWDSLNGMQKLGDMVPNLEGWIVLYSASGINDKGQIVGQGLTSDGEYHAFLLTPTNSITIDGDLSDWASLTPAFEDIQGDSNCDAYTDIKRVYTRKDDSHVYIMVETYGVPINPDAGIEMYFDYQPGQKVSHGYSDDLGVNIWGDTLYAYTDDLDPFPIIGYQIAWGAVMEISIPLSELETPDYFNITFVNTWDYDCLEPNDTTGCDPTRTNPFNFFALYSDNRQYDQVSFDDLPDNHPNYAGKEHWFMQAIAFTSGDETTPVILDSALTGAYTLKHWGEWETLGEYWIGTFTDLTSDYWGGPFAPPGPEWEDKVYTFSFGDYAEHWYIPSGSLQKLPIPNVTITGTLNPTISWDPVADANYYRVDIYPLTNDAGYKYPKWQQQLHSSGNITSISYTYEGDLFKDGKEYAIFVQARQNHPDQEYRGWINRSDYITTFSASTSSSLDVPLDIKPGSCPNPLNVTNRGVLPVAILGTADLDVTQIDVDSLRLEGVAPLRFAFEDVAAPFEPFADKKEPGDCNNSGADGFIDLTLKFETQEIVQALEEVSDGDEIVLSLSGKLSNGTEIRGQDVVLILKKGKKKDK